MPSICPAIIQHRHWVSVLSYLLTRHSVYTLNEEGNALLTISEHHGIAILTSIARLWGAESPVCHWGRHINEILHYATSLAWVVGLTSPTHRGINPISEKSLVNLLFFSNIGILYQEWDHLSRKNLHYFSWGRKPILIMKCRVDFLFSIKYKYIIQRFSPFVKKNFDFFTTNSPWQMWVS